MSGECNHEAHKCLKGGDAMARLNLDAKTGAEKRIAAWLEDHASEELAAKIVAAGPSMAQLMEHIQSAARKLDKTGGAVMVEDDVVFGWAVHFYEDLAVPEEDGGLKADDARAQGQEASEASGGDSSAEFEGMDLFGGVE